MRELERREGSRVDLGPEREGSLEVDAMDEAIGQSRRKGCGRGRAANKKKSMSRRAQSASVFPLRAVWVHGEDTVGIITVEFDRRRSYRRSLR